MSKDLKSKGSIVTPSSVNKIQDGLDQICQLWGLSSVGSKRVSSGEACRASVVNDWMSWLRRYQSSIGVPDGNLRPMNNVQVGSIMTYNPIDDVYANTQTVSNWCNRSECNTSECNKSECDRVECNTTECNLSESNSGESNKGEGG